MLVRVAPYVTRGVLALAALLLALIAARVLVDPVKTLAAYQITLGSSHALAAARVSFGAFPLAIAISVAGSAIRSRYVPMGIVLVLITMVTALVVRAATVLASGGLAENIGPLVGESVLLGLSLAALALEAARRNA